MTTTLIIRHDADLRGMLETDAAYHGYDADAVLQRYLDEVERQALVELDVDDVDVQRIDASGATRCSEIVRSDGSEMDLVERDLLDDIGRRALETAMTD